MSEARPGERTIGRYAMCAEIAAGGMATVHLGKLLGPVGFSRIVAIKALHPQFAKDPDFLSMFLDEARLAGRIRHPNVVSVLDVVARQGELYLVMDYVPGETLARLARAARAQNERVPLPIALAVVAGALEGLHAAHEACDEFGQPLGIVHRDVSPQNVLVGTDGVARILDFGVAKAVGRMQMTRGDQLKGKLAYMAPEQLLRAPIDRGADIYAASIVLWELLTRQRLFQGEDEVSTFKLALDALVEPPSSVAPELPELLDAIVLKGLARSREQRFATAREMARALEATGLMASAREVGDWVERIAREPLAERAARLSDVEQGPSHADAQAELDPEQARDDASMLRKIDHRAVAEVATEIVGAAPRVSAQSSSALAATEPGKTPARRVLPALLASCALLALSLLLVQTLRRSDGGAAREAEHPTQASAAAQTPPSAPATAPPIVASAPAASAAPSGTPPRAESASPAQHKPRQAARPSKPDSTLAKPKTDCAIPFTIDEHGVRIPKRQCL
ncbi:MAG TPA: serine/threonine-protein kinase [Polyangiaceae bacterium]|jgi:serine/threonine protein kinase|nr:serine/threonine-protein kinase [Polyangiaceae bacterium]